METLECEQKPQDQMDQTVTIYGKCVTRIADEDRRIKRIKMSLYNEKQSRGSRMRTAGFAVILRLEAGTVYKTRVHCAPLDQLSFFVSTLAVHLQITVETTMDISIVLFKVNRIWNSQYTMVHCGWK